MKKEKLIEEVRKYPFLYNINDVNYRNIEKKNQAWIDISNALSESEITCRRTWKNLRESLRRLKKKQSGSGKAATFSRKWENEDLMSFLLSKFAERPSPSITTSEIQLPGSVTSDLNNDYSYDQQISGNTEMPEVSENSIFNAASGLLLKYLIEEKEKKLDEMDHFILYVQSAIENLNPQNQIIVRLKIFQLISSIRLQQVRQNDQLFRMESEI